MSKPPAAAAKQLEEEIRKRSGSEKKQAASKQEAKPPAKPRRSLGSSAATSFREKEGVSSASTASSTSSSQRPSVFTAKKPANPATNSGSAATTLRTSSTIPPAAALARPSVFTAASSAAPSANSRKQTGSADQDRDLASPLSNHEDGDDLSEALAGNSAQSGRKEQKSKKQAATTNAGASQADHSASGSESSEHETDDKKKKLSPPRSGDTADNAASHSAPDEEGDTESLEHKRSASKSNAKPAAPERKAQNEHGDAEPEVESEQRRPSPPKLKARPKSAALERTAQSEHGDAEPERESIERRLSPPPLKARFKPAALDRRDPFNILKDECIDRMDAYERSDRPGSYRTRISGFFSSKSDTKNIQAKHEVVKEIKALIANWSLVVTAEDTEDASYDGLKRILQEEIDHEEITPEQSEKLLDIEIQVDKTVELLLALTEFADQAQKNVALSFYITSATKVGITSNTKIAIDEIKDKIWKYLANHLPEVHEALVKRVLSMLDTAEKLDKNVTADNTYLDRNTNKNRFKNKSAQLEYEADQIYPVSKAREALYTILKKPSSNRP